VGVYGKIHGALSHDFAGNSGSFAAAYFESGVHVDVLGSAKFAVWETKDNSFVPEKLRDIPVIRYGYQKVYSSFSDLPDKVVIDSLFFDLESAGLLDAEYLDLLTMESGTDTLSSTGIDGKYRVEFRLADGRYCRVSDGFLLVSDKDTSFTDELTVTIIGNDSFGRYRDGNSKYALISYTVPVEYVAEESTVDIPDGAAELNGRYYYVFRIDGIDSVEEAIEYCESRGGYLATLTGAEENAFVVDSLMKASGVDKAFIGMTLREDDGKWVWYTGENNSYLGFAEGESGGDDVAVCVGADGDYWDATEWDSYEYAFICEWGAYVVEDEMTIEEKLASLTGLYRGWYTAAQGITGVTVGIHRTNSLINDTELLTMYADYATECSKDRNGTVQRIYTVEEIREIVSRHTGEYIALYMFGPLRENPSVQDGIYTMNVTFNASDDTFSLTSVEWIQRETYDFVDCLAMKFDGVNLLGNIHMNYGWGVGYKIGDISVVKTDSSAN